MSEYGKYQIWRKIAFCAIASGVLFGCGQRTTGETLTNDSLTASLANWLVEELSTAYKTMRKQADDMASVFFPNREKVQVHLLTFNAGLLSMAPIAEVPYYKERSEAFERTLKSEIAKHPADVIFFQEVWHQKDRDTLAATAKNLDYYTVPTGASGKAHGLQILVRNKKVVEPDKIERGFEKHSSEYGWTTDRGMLWVRFDIKPALKIFAFTTHLTPTYGADKNNTRAKANALARKKSGRARQRLDPFFHGSRLQYCN